MGTNFYIVEITQDVEDIEVVQHIGKRSAAGDYCWDCKVTLCVAGNEGIHFGKEWHNVCPKCGKLPEEESVEDSSVGRELGFNKNRFTRNVGVKSCASFSWAIFLTDVKKLVKEGKMIRDEYGREYSYDDFIEMLKECPVQFNHLIGKTFS